MILPEETQEKYPNAKIYGAFEDKASCYAFNIKFENEADEAEFILRESI